MKASRLSGRVQECFSAVSVGSCGNSAGAGAKRTTLDLHDVTMGHLRF